MKLNRIMLFAFLFGVCAGWVHAQSVSTVTVTGNTVRCMLSNGSAVDFSPATENMVRVEYRQSNAGSNVSDIMDANYSSTLSFTNINQAGDPIILTGPNYSVTIAKAAFGIVFKNNAGTILFSSTSIGQYSLKGTIIAGNYYGLNNVTYDDDYDPSKGLVQSGDVTLFNSTATNEGRGTSPFTWTTKGFGIFVDAERGDFNFANATTLNITRSSTSPACANTNCLFFLMAGTPLQIMSGYYKASGSYPVPPRWTCGFMNSEWGLDETELKTIVQTYRSKNIPLDGFIFDYDWFNYNNALGGTDGDFQWEVTKAFPSASANYNASTGGDLKRWADGQGVKFIGIRKPHGIWAGSKQWGNCGNFADPAIRKTYWEKFVNPAWDSYGRGMIAYWNDEAEACNNISDPFEPLNMQKSLYMGQRYDSTAGLPQYHNNRVWSLNRSYFAGAQKYAFGNWSGDIECSNQSLQDNRLFMLSSVNVGGAWWGQDIGGFKTDPSSADYLHWMQFGAFTPIYRVHGNEGCQRQPWVYTSGYTSKYSNNPADGGVAERVATKYIKLRYALIPYIYSAYWKLHRDGIPLVRPLVMDYPADNTVAQSIDSWMFGDNFLVSPVVSGYTATTKSVYLPQGNWVNYWTDATYVGGAATAIGVNTDTIPVLVKQGAIIPTQKVVSYLNNYPITQNTNNAIVPVSFHVYGGANGTFEYFDDDGVTYDYEKGQYRDIVYTHMSTNADEQVTVGAKQGSYTPAADSNGTFVFHTISWTPVSVSVQSGDISPNKVVVSALASAAAPAWAWDNVAKQVLVKVVSPFAAGTVRISSTTGVVRRPSSVFLKSTNIRLNAGRLLIPISFSGNNGLSVKLIAGSGAVVKEFKLSALSQGEQTLSLTTGNLAQGVCFVRLSSGDCTVLKKILVVR